MQEKELSIAEIQQKLAEPFKVEEVEWRVIRAWRSQNNDGKMWAKVAPYVDSRTVMNRFDEVLGIDNWEDDYKEIHHGTLCSISIHFPNGKTITKRDGADLTNIEPIKGGLSGALKRAAVHWGVGRYLYDLEEELVEIIPNTKQGKYYINDKNQNVTGRWNPPELPDWAIPKGSNQRNNPPVQPVNTNRGNNKSSNTDRTKLIGFITKSESILGLNKKPEHMVRIFNKANNVQVEGINSIKNSSMEQLIKYWAALKPVYNLKRIQEKYGIQEKEFLKMVQTFVVDVEIKGFLSCLFNIDQEKMEKIATLARDTYKQRKSQAS